jgi:hypothetical protein
VRLSVEARGRRVRRVSTRRCCVVVNLNLLLEGCSNAVEAGVGGGDKGADRLSQGGAAT